MIILILQSLLVSSRFIVGAVAEVDYLDLEAVENIGYLNFAKGGFLHDYYDDETSNKIKMSEGKSSHHTSHLHYKTEF